MHTGGQFIKYFAHYIRMAISHLNDTDVNVNAFQIN